MELYNILSESNTDLRQPVGLEEQLLKDEALDSEVGQSMLQLLQVHLTYPSPGAACQRTASPQTGSGHWAACAVPSLERSSGRDGLPTPFMCAVLQIRRRFSQAEQADMVVVVVVCYCSVLCSQHTYISLPVRSPEVLLGSMP